MPDVILLKDVDKVGLRGEVVSVSRGYMRNYLQPRRLAEPATAARVAELERREAERARHEARSVEQAEAIAETLRKTVLSFEVNAGPQGTLFGSVTPTDIADEIWRTRKIRIDRRKIGLGDPIKRIGRYQVPIAVFEDVHVDVKTLVVPIGGELPPEEELEAMAAAEEAEKAAADGEAAEAPDAVEAAIAEVEQSEAEAEATAEVGAAAETGDEQEEAAPAPELAPDLTAEEEVGVPADEAESEPEPETAAGEPDEER